MTKRLLAVALLAVGCASQDAPPPASTPAPQESQVAALQTSLTELLERMDVMNERLSRLEESRMISAPAPAPVPVPVTVPRAAPTETQAQMQAQVQPAPQPVQPQPSRALAGAQLADNYRAAIVLYGKGRAADARQAFQAVFDSDPSGELADNALVWIGETYFNAGDFQNAMRYYRRVAADFGDQNKAPDALYKMGLALAKTSDLALARRTLEDVIQRYPYSSAAASAKQELARIKY